MIRTNSCLLLLIILVISQSNAFEFGFKVVQTSNDLFTLSLFLGNEQYQCHILGPSKDNTIYTCDTNNITQTSQCYVEPDSSIIYALQISKTCDDTIRKHDDDVRITSIIYNGQEIDTDKEWIGDGPGGKDNFFYRYYDLGNDLNNLPTFAIGNTTKNDGIPACYTGENKIIMIHFLSLYNHILYTLYM